MTKPKTRISSRFPRSGNAPQRTCVACRQIRDKRELVRLVRLPDNIVELDTKGKTPGRGAYLCRKRECWESGLSGGRLEHTLKTKITPDNKNRLNESWKALLDGEQW